MFAWGGGGEGGGRGHGGPTGSKKAGPIGHSKHPHAAHPGLPHMVSFTRNRSHPLWSHPCRFGLFFSIPPYQVVADSALAEREEAVTAFNAAHRWRKRGITATPTKFGISFTTKFLNQAGALMHIYTDGSVLVTHGGVEMGQGLHTKVAQVAAQALGVPLAKVFIAETSTDKVGRWEGRGEREVWQKVTGTFREGDAKGDSRGWVGVDPSVWNKVGCIR